MIAETTVCDRLDRMAGEALKRGGYDPRKVSEILNLLLECDPLAANRLVVAEALET